MPHGRKSKRPHKRAAEIGVYIEQYLLALRALLNSVAPGSMPTAPEIVAVGPSDVWPCIDGAIVLITADAGKQFTVRVRTPTGMSVNAFIRDSREMTLYTPDGEPAKPRIALHLDKTEDAVIQMAGMILSNGRTVLRTRHAKAWIVGWDAAFPESPDAAALKDFRAAFIQRNMAGAVPAGMPDRAAAALAHVRAMALLAEYRELLANAVKEEEIQSFVKSHPEILYPDYISTAPKMPLGSEYIPDFVVHVQGQQGPEHVFCEIERPSKGVFIASGQFSSEFTQAKNQLLDWDTWITRNHAYVRETIPGLSKPLFHLVMGRSSQLNEAQRAKLQAEFVGTTRRFSTFDDLADRLEQMIKHLLPNS